MRGAHNHLGRATATVVGANNDDAAVGNELEVQGEGVYMNEDEIECLAKVSGEDCLWMKKPSSGHQEASGDLIEMGYGPMTPYASCRLLLESYCANHLDHLCHNGKTMLYVT